MSRTRRAHGGKGNGMGMRDACRQVVNSVEEAMDISTYLSFSAKAVIEASLRRDALTCAIAAGGYLVTITQDDHPDAIPVRMVGSALPLNGDVPMRICRNKVLASVVMEDEGVPCIPHVLAGDVDESDVSDIAGKSADGRIVAKPTCGMQGRDVTLLRGGMPADMLREVHEMSAADGYELCDVCLSPYQPGTECRAIVLDGRVLLSYAKGRGRGSDPKEWRSNLCLGNVPVELPDSVDASSLHALTRFAADAIGLRFASVDIIVDDRGGMQVLEVHGIPAVTKWAGCVPDGWERSVALYGEALDACLRDASGTRQTDTPEKDGRTTR